jgi:DNA replication protein DnaC
MKNSLEHIINGISQSVPRSDNEYVDNDGLLRCRTCDKRVETIVNVFGKDKKVRCICDCRKKELNEYKEVEKAQEREKIKKVCFMMSNMGSWTFANDDNENAEISNAMKNYADNFAEFKKSGIGLLLFGTVGTGKTFYAACIANELIDKGYTVLMTNFARLINQLQGKFEGRQEYIDSLNDYSLLIIDDLGAERSSEYMQETVFNIIDARYRAGLPFIITTNLTLEEIANTEAIAYKRIYDRILERCYPVEVEGQSRRKGNFRTNMMDIGKKLGL